MDGYFEPPNQVGNGDLWRELDILLQARAVGSVTWVKVKRHVRTSDVRAGAVSLEERRGNDAADVLAKRGAFRHRASWAIRAKRRNARKLAMAAQAILSARNAALRSRHGGTGDAGHSHIERASMVSISDDEVIDVSSGSEADYWQAVGDSGELDDCNMLNTQSPQVVISSGSEADHWQTDDAQPPPQARRRPRDPG